MVAGGPRRLVTELTPKYALRGADLWHLGTAKTLQNEVPDVRVFTFDDRLAEALRGEGLA
jgi:predicted nucleic acid-binding protein